MSAPPIATTSSPSAASTRRYSPGDLVAGKYLLAKLIGEGGMGGVWLAHNMDLDTAVAIKVLAGDAAPAEAALRLRREARAEARLEHRAIVRVFDCGETERGDPFIVMELLEGRTLADVLDAKRTLGVVPAIQILLPIIDGLSAAHAEGIVHRDIKPENIFLAEGARRIQPKVVDFGIAKVEAWDPNPNITLQGTIIGSPSYMAPEQARGLGDVDHRSDIWAVCAVLYEALTGRPPFRGESYNAVLRSIIEDEVTPLTGMGDDEAAVWTVLERGFAKDRARRYQTMRELGTALAAVLLERGTSEDICGEPIATAWGTRQEPSDDLYRPRFGSAGSPRPSLLTQLLPGSEAPRRRAAPISTSGVETPSRVVRRLPRDAAYSSLAALVVIGLTAAAVSKWNDPTPTSSAARVQTSSDAPAFERAGMQAPGGVDVPAAPLSATPIAARSTPTAAVVGKPHAPEQQPARLRRGKAHHGWPEPQTESVLSPPLSAADPGSTATWPKEPTPRVAPPDRATASSLGLKDPYR
jgi:serine/threonine protein kinase